MRPEEFSVPKTREELEFERANVLRRRATRFPVHGLEAEIHIAVPKQEPQRHAAQTIDISARGVLLLCKNFVHAGKPCLLRLESLDHHTREIQGEVRWCDYELERGHFIGIEFYEVIDPRSFVEQDVVDATVEAELGIASNIEGTILVATGPRLRRELETELNELGYPVRYADSAATALGEFMARPIDILITDRTLGTAGPGGELALGWRERGFTGPLMLIGEKDDLQLGGIAARLGATDVIRHPWPPDRLSNAIYEALTAFPLRTESNDVFSTIEAIYGTPVPVRAFINHAQQLSGMLMEAQRVGEAETYAAILRQLESEAVESGFPHFAAVLASASERFIRSGNKTFSAFDDARRLAAYAARLACRADGVAA